MGDFEETFSPFWDHLGALRQTFIKIFLCVLAGFILAFCFYEPLFAFLTKPIRQEAVLSSDGLIRKTLQRQRVHNPTEQPIIFQNGSHSHMIGPGSYVDIDLPSIDNRLVIISPLDGMLTAFKLCFWTGLIVTAPFWCFTLLQFILPALKSYEKALILPFLGLSLLFLSLGFLFAYHITIPLANQYLEKFNAGIGVNLWSLSHYLDYTIVLLLGHSLAFEFCLIILFLVHMRVISVEQMISWRRRMIVAAFILGAILTPPDIFSQVMLAIPLIALYEIAILYARFRSISNHSHQVDKLSS
jgi:sec-independent protein translocase protein TatC